MISFKSPNILRPFICCRFHIFLIDRFTFFIVIGIFFKSPKFFQTFFFINLFKISISCFFVDPDRIVLPTSITGSRRHLNSLSLDALTAVAEIGEPTLFITATCNAKWREILERLPEHQTAFDRPDITVPVFKKS